MKVAIAGNCQAETLRWMSTVADKRLQVEQLPAYHELTAETEPLVHAAFEDAEAIFAQRVAEDFYIESLRPSRLKERYGDKCSLWPNIYFDGYFPGLRYLYRLDGHKVVGPLGDYHFQQIIDGWVARKSNPQILESLLSTQGWPWCEADPAEQSLNQLRRREQDCDVIISDHIARNFRTRKLMHSMNHPVNSVLMVLFDRLMERHGLPAQFQLETVHQVERLNEMEIPLLPISRQLYMPELNTPLQFKGTCMVKRGDIWERTNHPYTFYPQEMVSLFIDIYNTLPDQLDYLKKTA